MRNLATIQKIVDIRPIPNADKIEVAQVLGWECVVSKSDNFKVGDGVIYIEIDSIVPEKPEFEFLRDRKFRVRTIKLKGQVSQGLILPMSYLKNNSPVTTKYYIGYDVTEELGIRKYDPQADLEEKLAREVQTIKTNKVNKYFLKYSWYRRLFYRLFPKEKHGFPSFIKKTDEVRIQNYPVDFLGKISDFPFVITEKLDGQSATYFVVKNKRRFLWFGDKYIFGVCSRNLYLFKPNESSYWKIAKQYNLESKMKRLADLSNLDTFVIQGEIIGEGIQGNKYKISGVDFYVFNCIKNGVHLSYDEQSFYTDCLNIKQVPLLNHGVPLHPTISAVVEYSKGNSKLAEIPREGVVIRNTPKGISFKVINPDFLLKYGE